MIALALLLACHGGDNAADSAGGVSDDVGGDDTGFQFGDDTGFPSPRADDTWSSGTIGGWEGYEIVAGVVDGDARVLVGAPIGTATGYYADARATVSALDVTGGSLAWTGSFVDDSDNPSNSEFGTAIAIARDGTQIAIGAMDADESADARGLVYLLAHLPDGAQVPDPTLLLLGDNGSRTRLGIAVAFVDLRGEGESLVAAASSADITVPGMIYEFDRYQVGSFGLDAALTTLGGTDERFGRALTAWDCNGDGLDEVVTTTAAGVAHFASPWSGDPVQADADAEWTDPLAEADGLGEPLGVVGDLDGDGLSELSIGAETFSGADFRSGAEYLVSGGALASSVASDLATQIVGVALAEGVGRSATSGDFDGDGSLDLVVGAYHVNDPHAPGQVLGYFGPIGPGVRASTDADFVATGQYPFDWFGSDVAAVDSDGDAQSDLVVGAQGWDYGMGKVYLFFGSTLVP